MNKAELVKVVASHANISQATAEAAVNAVTSAIGEALNNGEKVTLVGFGTFSVKERSARIGRNPKTGAEIDIPASKVPHFKSGGALRELVG